MSPGPGIYICDKCVGKCSGILDQPAPANGHLEVNVWEGLSEEEMLTKLPRISAVAEQVEQSMKVWGAELRRCGVIRAEVGKALQVTRQSAWTRFSTDT